MVTFVEAARFNHKLSSKVDDIFMKLVSIRLDSDLVFECYVAILKENDDLANQVEASTIKMRFFAPRLKKLRRLSLISSQAEGVKA